MPVNEGQLLWQPSEAQSSSSNIRSFITWLAQERDVHCEDYETLWKWSVSDIEEFWASAWDYFEIRSDNGYEAVISQHTFEPGIEWFTGSRTNFAEHVLRMARPGETAIYFLSEQDELAEFSWDDLTRQVRILATKMRAMGVEPGDSVACLMPNTPETVIAMLASISIGALWTNAAPEFGRQTILDRFSQTRPKWLFVTDGYVYGGRSFDRRGLWKEIANELSDTLEQVVWLPKLFSRSHLQAEPALLWHDLLDGPDPGPEGFFFERVAHTHPLWVLFSSGTTGLPKAIVHSHIGALMELLKLNTFHMDLKEGDTAFFYTTTGWVMFNIQVAMLLTGAKIVLYDGNPASPEPDVLWKMASDTRATLFGASPSFVQLMQKARVVPSERYDLSYLKSILCSGSPAQPETFDWFYKNVADDLWLTSQSGGTEIVGGFVVASPTLPVYAGEIQTRALGMDIDVWDENGESLVNEVGELVCKQPFPSMPMYFLNDSGHKKYMASYFEVYERIWTHGDLIKINERGGCYIYGRSDSTLNRCGVRIGTAELYRVIEQDPEVEDSLVVSLELADGKSFMPMFLQLATGVEIDDEVEGRLKQILRSQCSPRHVPDAFYQVPEIPYTLTGKKLEIPVRKLLMGAPPDQIASKDALRNPSAIDWFVQFASTGDEMQSPLNQTDGAR